MTFAFTGIVVAVIGGAIWSYADRQDTVAALALLLGAMACVMITSGVIEALK